MSSPLESLVACGTKLWLDSVDPDEIARNRGWGASGATSNPIIIKNLIATGHFDEQLSEFIREGLDNEAIAWKMTDQLVRQAQEAFQAVWKQTKGNDGYVSFELDPLIEDPDVNLPLGERTKRYIDLGMKWSADHNNRMIKVPNTPAGRAALERLAAAGVSLNVTLTFTTEQYIAARDAVWRGAQHRRTLDAFKSVYSIFVSRVDVYTEKYLPHLSAQAQGEVGIVNAKRIWKMNQEFWADKNLPLQQEIIFASTGTKKASDPPWKYVEAFAGSDIETNPPETNHAVQESGRTFTRKVDEMPSAKVLAEIDAAVNYKSLEDDLMEEGVRKFTEPQHALLAMIAKKRAALQAVAAR
ncbi:MAG: transaldolase [Planctomycetes bacterium]|nr:transaldolase [Planctomycetota bacterium]